MAFAGVSKPSNTSGPKRSFGNNDGPRRGSFNGPRGGAGGSRGGPGGPRGGSRGGPGGFAGGRGGGMRPGVKVIVEPFKHAGIFIARGKEDVLATKNMVPGSSVYGEKLIEIKPQGVEYRSWNPFRSKLAAALIGGIDDVHIAPGKKVLYLGAASGTTVSHVSDIVGPEGRVYAVEFSKRVARDLLNLAQVRPNIVPIIADARKPSEYKMLVSMVDTIFADVAQPDQSRIVVANAELFLKNEGGIVISIKASCVDSTAAPEAIFASEVDFMKKNKIKPSEQITLEPYHRDHAIVIGKYRVSVGKK